MAFSLSRHVQTLFVELHILLVQAPLMKGDDLIDIIVLLLLFLILAAVLQFASPFSLIPDLTGPNGNYNLFTLPLPQPPGIMNLPANLYFYIDRRFTAVEVSRIKTIISNVLGQWKFHLTQKWNGGLNNGVSSWALCAQTYAFNGLKPYWHNIPVPNGQTALEIAMDEFTQLFRDNGFKLSPPTTIDYRIPFPITSSTIFGAQAFQQTKVPLSITVNPKQIDRTDLTNGALEGSLVHAWLHRAGFDHPSNVYTTYFSGEAAMCYMRGYTPKNPAVPDSSFTQLFD
ncbi:hypothetical protein [Priestia megaterium]